MLSRGDQVILISTEKYTDNGIKPPIPLNSECIVVGYMDRDRTKVMVEHDGRYACFVKEHLMLVEDANKTRKTIL